MNIFAVSAFINGISALIFGLIVYSKNPKNLVNQTFGLMTFALTIWSFGYGFWQIAKDHESALFWVRILSIGSTFIPIFFIHWVLALFNLHKKKERILIFGYIITLIFLCFSFTSLYVKDVSPQFFFPWWPEAGIVYNFYLIFGYFGGISYVSYELSKIYRERSGYIREQIKYILLAMVVGFGGGATNFPLWYGIPLPPYGNFLVALYPFILSYAILKYRLMDIRYILGRGTVYGLSLITIVAFAFFLIFLTNQFLVALPFNITAILVLIISVLFFQPIFRFFESFASKYFYYTFYSYQTVLTDMGRGLTRYLDLNKLSSLIVTTLMNTMKLDRTVVLIREPGDGEYRIQKNIGFKEENGISLVKDNFLTVWLEKNQKPLVYEELSLIIRDTTNREEKEKMEKLKANMKKIEAALCLPLLIEEKIIGMIVLGNKVSGDPYSEQDIDLLTNLSNQASIALQNAKLYSEVEGFGQKMEREVEKRTAELKEAYEELQKLDKAKSEFVSIASHQLRTPLTAIKGYISMMIEKTYGKPPAKMQKPLENIYASNERLIKLVNDLLNVSRIEAGRIELKLEKTSVEEVISSVVEELKNEADIKNIYLKFEKPKKPLPQILVDKDKIRQAIMNLIDNAIRYTAKGGITVNTKVLDSKLQIMVNDTGEGMTKEEMSNLFESFSRGTAGTRFWTEGAGLGLYVAKKFVDMQKGKIWAESEGKNKGSTFYLEIPIA
ncbi:MAG: ATP-binding protein [Candidatus Pacebacteria bacterium]|nr:ATP-binding protein [Candidatus Paceibacterota bacterium]